MEPTLNFLDTYMMIAIQEEITPVPTFFHDRYFETGADDVFNADKVLVEVMRDGEYMAPFVSPRAGDIPMDREGYTVHEFEPPYIAPSRLLTVDEVKKRGFGEALYANTQPAERASRIQRKDQEDLDKSISRREEWMCAQTMLNNACEMQEYTDDQTVGRKLYVKFFDGAHSEHTYTVAKKWDAGGNPYGDVVAMCNMLVDRGLPAEDLLLGPDAYEALMNDDTIIERIKTFSGINGGAINEQLTSYRGVTYCGKINFEGNVLDVFVVRETYATRGSKKRTPFFPVDGAMVTYPGCGRLRYGRITQMDDPFSATLTDHTGTRIPKLIVDQPHDIRKLRLASRPLAMPKEYTPWIFAEKVVGVDP